MTQAAEPVPNVEPDSKPARAIPLPGLWVWLTCALIAIAASAPTLSGSDFLWTDQELILQNSMLRTLAGLQRIWFDGIDPATYPLPNYSPLTQTTFFIDRMIFGRNVWGYHLTSMLIHASAATVLWQLLRRLSIPGALVAALLFAAHPITVESNVLLGERRNPLALLLGLSSMFFLLRAANIIPATTAPRKLLPDDPVRLYAMGIAIFLLGLFAHAAIATLPAVMLLIAWWKSRKVSQTLLLIAVTLMIAGFGMLTWTSAIEKARTYAPSPTYWNRAETGAGELVVRTQIASRAAVFYATKMAVPLGLAVDYPRWRTEPDVARIREMSADQELAARRTVEMAANVPMAYVWPIGVVAVVAGVWIGRKKIGDVPLLLVGSYLLLLLPSLGFIDVGWMRNSFVADRGAYLACMPFVLGVALIASRLLVKAGDSLSFYTSSAVLTVIYVLLGVSLSERASRNEAYFWFRSANAVADSRSWLPRYQYANALLSVNAPLDEAIRAVADVRRVRPDEPAPLVVQGIIDARLGDQTKAMSRFEESMKLFPSYAPAYYHAADMFRAQAEARPTNPTPRRLALEGYQATVERDPLDAVAHVRLGEACYEFARRLEPGDPNVHPLIERALQAFDAAVVLRPYDVNVLVRVAETLIKLERPSNAAALLLTARNLEPERADIYMAIADASLQIRDIDGGEKALQAAIHFDPTLVQAYINLGMLRKAQERWEESEAFLAKAVELDPRNEQAQRELADLKTQAATRPSASPTTRPATLPTTN